MGDGPLPDIMDHDTKAGVELELWVVDDRGRLSSGTALAEGRSGVMPEFVDPLIEVQTEPHETAAGLRRDLVGTLRELIDAADEAGKRLVPLGTPLTASEVPVNGERGRLFETIYGAGVTSAKNCAGTHVHFEKADVVEQLNLLTALDPALSLVSSSPYYLGRRGADSSRAVAYRRKCGPEFRLFCDLWDYADSLSEWEGRVETAYEVFQRLAADRGVDPERVAESFEPEDTVLNPVRRRTCQPTVEWRAPDSALPSQVLRLADDVRGLMDRLENSTLAFGAPEVTDRHVRVPEFETLAGLSQAAIHEGLRSERVRQYLQHLGFDPGAYQPMSQQLYGPLELSRPAACELRLEYARRLRTDVQTLAEPNVETVGRRQLYG